MQDIEEMRRPWKKRRISENDENSSLSKTHTFDQTDRSLGESNETSSVSQSLNNDVELDKNLSNVEKSLPQDLESYSDESPKEIESDNQFTKSSTSKWNTRKKHGASRLISKQMIQQVMHMKQKAAAKELRIGVSTLKKRFGKLFQNDRWPSTDAERLKMASFIVQQAKEKASLRYILRDVETAESFLDQQTMNFLQQQITSKKERRSRTGQSRSASKSSRNGGFVLIEPRLKDMISAEYESNDEEEDGESEHSEYENPDSQEGSHLLQRRHYQRTSPTVLNTITNILPSAWGIIPTNPIKHFREISNDLNNELSNDSTHHEKDEKESNF